MIFHEHQSMHSPHKYSFSIWEFFGFFSTGIIAKHYTTESESSLEYLSWFFLEDSFSSTPASTTNGENSLRKDKKKSKYALKQVYSSKFIK